MNTTSLESFFDVNSIIQQRPNAANSNIGVSSFLCLAFMENPIKPSPLLLIYKDHLKLCQAFSSDNTWQLSAQKDFSEIPKVHQILGGRQKRLRYFFSFFTTTFN